jgi:hypothetical protein
MSKVWGPAHFQFCIEAVRLGDTQDSDNDSKEEKSTKHNGICLAFSIWHWTNPPPHKSLDFNSRWPTPPDSNKLQDKTMRRRQNIRSESCVTLENHEQMSSVEGIESKLILSESEKCRSIFKIRFNLCKGSHEVSILKPWFCIIDIQSLAISSLAVRQDGAFSDEVRSRGVFWMPGWHDELLPTLWICIL